ncbi:hypothetical protein BAUCODRAFT_33315 [Baudoinia panamericana UAMH 10762]|uniref:Uncharacterized protein n=1 Tax=Baudoinia panamericana (strain UAMH 10762) TaxID=717646 RepID=M2LSW7_BAUPA|nr:uncharacterized protein BAUCODRAFT_33315 [Baudoinia panamericana UAMH 10762]EMC97592.1 hypothetical protein BAUCODRAFT_33315 [Baudoinia panamericana UAMH 10762]
MLITVASHEACVHPNRLIVDVRHEVRGAKEGVSEDDISMIACIMDVETVGLRAIALQSWMTIQGDSW